GQPFRIVTQLSSGGGNTWSLSSVRSPGSEPRPRCRSLVRWILVGGEMLAPFGFAFGECEVCHEMLGCGTVPVPFAGWGDDDVAGSDADEWSATGLDEAFAFG